MFDATRRGVLRSIGGAAWLAPSMKPGRAAGVREQSGLVFTGPASADGRRVTFTGEVHSAARESGWRAARFWYGDYNGFWYPTPATPLDELAGTAFSITDTVPYSNRVFPYFASLTADPGADPEFAVFGSADPFPAERGEIRQVTVPSTADTVSVETVAVSAGETTITVRGRVADYGKALDIYAGAHYGSKSPFDGPISTVVKKAPGDDPRFQAELRGLSPNAEYVVRAVAAVPAGPILDTAYGNDVTVATGRPSPGTRHALSIESTGGGFAAYDAVLTGDVALGGNADGNEIRGPEGDGTLVRGHVGPDRGVDDVTYDGEIEALVLAGPARAAVDGYEIDPHAYPARAASVTPADLSTGSGSNTLEIRSAGGGIAAYELAVSGALRAGGDVEESVEDGRVIGHLGPDRGRDTFRFEGDVTTFRLAGPATVALDGRRIETGTAERTAIEIRADGGGVAVYDFTVGGSLRPGTSDEESEVSGRRGHGHVGPDRGVDSFVARGPIETFALVGPATVRIDGARVDPHRYPLPAGSLTAADFDPGPGTSRLRIASTGGGVAAYEFAVTGDLRPAADAADERITGTAVTGRVGPDRGVDTFSFTGAVSRFRLVGPAEVSLDGVRVTSGT